MKPKSAVLTSVFCVAISLAAGAWGSDAADPYAAVLAYRFGQPRDALLAIEAQIRAAKPADLRAIETKLLTILQSPAASADGKEWTCRQLRQVGSEQAVSLLGPMLADKDLATAARLALQSIPGAKIDAALRDAVAKLQGDLKAGAILTLGARRDVQAVSLLAPLASNADATIAEAALYALGNIGTTDALTAVQSAKAPAGLTRYRFHTILRCAEQMASTNPAQAAAVYQDVFQHADDPVIKIAALRGIVSSDKARATPIVRAVLTEKNARLRIAAAQLTCERGGPEILNAVLGDLPSLTPDVQVVILGQLDDKSALPAVQTAVASSDADVRMAALRTLGRLGDCGCVGVLLQVAATSKDEEQATARKSVQALREAGVGEALIAAAASGQPGVRVEAIRALAARNTASAVPTLLKTAADADRNVQSESLAAVGVLGQHDVLPELVRLLSQAKQESDREPIENAAAAVCRRADDQEAAIGLVLVGLAGANAETRCALLRVIAKVPTAKGLEALRSAVKDTDPAVKDTGVRGLSDWPDASPLPDLMQITRTSDSKVHRVLALRGAIRLAALPSKRAVAQRAKLLGELMSLATRSEEKKLVLAALGDFIHPSVLDLAVGCLADPAVEVEAATAVVRIARQLASSHPDAAKAAVQKILDTCKSPAARQIADSAFIVLGRMVNIAPQGVASSPDGLEKDGQAGGDQAAIDNNPATYWDEADNKELYRLVVTFKQPVTVAAVSVTGYRHHDYAPKKFDILCDGKVVKTVVGAKYEDNLLIVRLDETTCRTVELKITGCYGRSPAIRELGIYRPEAKK